MIRIERETLAAWLEDRDLPLDGIDVERLHEGYLKLRQMIDAMRRPDGLETGLAVDFEPEPLR